MRLAPPCLAVLERIHHARSHSPRSSDLVSAVVAVFRQAQAHLVMLAALLLRHTQARMGRGCRGSRWRGTAVKARGCWACRWRARRTASSPPATASTPSTVRLWQPGSEWRSH